MKAKTWKGSSKLKPQDQVYVSLKYLCNSAFQWHNQLRFNSLLKPLYWPKLRPITLTYPRQHFLICFITIWTDTKVGVQSDLNMQSQPKSTQNMQRNLGLSIATQPKVPRRSLDWANQENDFLTDQGWTKLRPAHFGVVYNSYTRFVSDG